MSKIIRIALLAAISLFFTTSGWSQAADPAPNEHLKIENGVVWERVQDQSWKQVGPATLAVAVKALQDIYPDITIAVNPKLATLPLADLKVRADDPKDDLEALRATADSQFEIETPQNLNNPDPKLFTLGPNATFARVQQEAAGGREIQVFSLTGYLAQRIKDDNNAVVLQLQDVIKQTIGDLDADIPAPKFRFHEEAKLLVVIGTPKALEVAGKVISALPGEQATWYGVNEGNRSYDFVGSGGVSSSYGLSAPPGAYRIIPHAPDAPPAPAADAVPATPAAPAAPAQPAVLAK